jgi:Lrp/AsnC family transcriptional regulator for asnA, asnC and gidA
MRIDELDVKILKILLKDSRTSFAKIAYECKTSAEVIRVRYLNLKKNGIIHSEVLEVIPNAIGINCFGHININILKEPEQIEGLLNSKSYIVATK